MSKSKTAMDKTTLQAAIKSEMESVTGNSGGVLSTARTQLMEAYLGNDLPMDEERRKDGWSTYKDRTVLETVEWAKPGLLRVFASYDDIVRFDPARPGQEQNAKDATAYVNQIIFGHRAFKLIHDVIMDSLLQRVAWGMVYFDEDPDRQVTKEYSGLTEQEVMALLMQNGTENQEVERDKKTGLYSVRVYTNNNTQPVRVETVPSENVVWNKDARDMETCRFVAHWKDKTIAELEGEGYEIALLDDLDDDSDSYPETDVQSYINSDSGADDLADRGGKMRRVRVYEAYMLMPDASADGSGECRYKVVFTGTQGDVILSSEKWNMPRPPLFPVSSVSMPHQVGGLCIADLVLDIQMLRSELMRQLLDNIALTNQGELHVNRGSATDEIDMDQLLSRRIGGVYLSKGAVTITPLPTDPRASNEAAAALGMTDQLKENRTGVGPQMQGLQADALQNTATGAVINEDAANQRLETIARILAEDFFKPVSKYVLLLVSRHQNRPIQAWMNDKFSTWNPAEWDPDMDVSVSVGLGTGNRSRQTQNMQMIMGYQEKIATALGENSPIKLHHIIFALSKMISGMGFAAPEQFVGTIEDATRAEQAIAQKPQDDSSPEKQKMLLEQQKAQADMRLAQQKAQADMALQQAKARADEQLAREKAQGELALQTQKIEAEKQLSAVRMQSEMQLDQTKMILQGGPAPGTTQIRQANI